MLNKALLAAGLATAISLGPSAPAAAHGPDAVCAEQPCGWHFGPMTGPGNMGPGHMHMMAPGISSSMMGRGHMPIMGPGMGFGMMGPGMAHGFMQPLSRDLSAEDVQHMLGHRLAMTGNPNIKLGTVSEKDDDTIVAEIVTQEGSLVQRLEVDRHTGWTRPAK